MSHCAHEWVTTMDDGTDFWSKYATPFMAYNSWRICMILVREQFLLKLEQTLQFCTRSKTSFHVLSNILDNQIWSSRYGMVSKLHFMLWFQLSYWHAFSFFAFALFHGSMVSLLDKVTLPYKLLGIGSIVTNVICGLGIMHCIRSLLANCVELKAHIKMTKFLLVVYFIISKLILVWLCII
jgi:hypothetical protein